LILVSIPTVMDHATSVRPATAQGVIKPAVPAWLALAIRLVLVLLVVTKPVVILQAHMTAISPTKPIPALTLTAMVPAMREPPTMDQELTILAPV